MKLWNYITLAAIGIASASPVIAQSGNETEEVQILSKRCCAYGCYSVKAGGWSNAGCTGQGQGASIANYGSYGKCVDLRNAASVRANNDGCGSSHVDMHFFRQVGCPGAPGGGFKTIRSNGGGQCYVKPAGAVGLVAVSN